MVGYGENECERRHADETWRKYKVRMDKMVGYGESIK